MDHFAGLDVSVKETSVCIVDDTGKIIREVKVASGLRSRRRNSLRPDAHVPRSPARKAPAPLARSMIVSAAASNVDAVPAQSAES